MTSIFLLNVLLDDIFLIHRLKIAMMFNKLNIFLVAVAPVI